MRERILYILAFFITLVLDQATKFLVEMLFPLYHSRPIFGDVLRLTYIRNAGAAFGLSFGSPVVMFVIAVVVTGLIALMIVTGRFKSYGRMGKTALVMVLGGGVGNLIDRIRLGEVIDFIDMGIGSYRWPVYNVADIFVTVGIAFLLYSYTFSEPSRDSSS